MLQCKVAAVTIPSTRVRKARFVAGGEQVDAAQRRQKAGVKRMRTARISRRPSSMPAAMMYFAISDRLEKLPVI